jgi:hypothetical protein
MSGNITYSKVRAAMTGASTQDNAATLPYANGYPMGYGEPISGISYVPAYTGVYGYDY